MKCTPDFLTFVLFKLPLCSLPYLYTFKRCVFSFVCKICFCNFVFSSTVTRLQYDAILNVRIDFMK